MAFNLFGFTFGRKPDRDEVFSIVAPSSEDGATVISGGGLQGQYVDLDGTVRNETDMIRKYRDMALNAEVELAIDDITNEVITEDAREKTVKLNLDRVNDSDSVKDKITEAFEEVLSLLEFDKRAFDMFRRFYIDGRLYYHIILHENKKKGAKEYRFVDPLRIKKIKEVKQKDEDDLVNKLLSVKDLLKLVNYEFNELYIDKFWNNITDEKWLYIDNEMLLWIGYSDVDLPSAKRTYSLILKESFEENKDYKSLNSKEFNIYKSFANSRAPIGRISGLTVKVFPDTTESLSLTYLRKIKYPKWTYVIASGAEMFNPDADDFQDADIHSSEEDEMVRRVLLRFGIHLKEKDIQAYLLRDEETEFKKSNTD